MDVNIRRSPEGRSGAGMQRREKQEYTRILQFGLSTRRYLCDGIKEKEINGTCRTYLMHRKFKLVLEDLKRKKQHGRTGSRQ